jgi:histidinol-phosphate/aromatic aminotransferase/cobyric acid decarboxylase-like protein
VAYLCGNATDIRALRRLTPPWAVSLPAQVAAVAALADPAYYEARHAETAVLRREFAAQLQAAVPAVVVIEGVANFVLCLLPRRGPDAAEVCARCREQDVFLRDVGNMGSSLGSHALRCAVKDGATNRRVAQLLADVLAA